jgi:hypothetical protein
MNVTSSAGIAPMPLVSIYAAIFFCRSLITIDSCLSRCQNASFSKTLPVSMFAFSIDPGAEEPPQPIGYVHSALLRVLKNLIVAPSLFANLGRHAVEALRAVSNRAEDISVMARAILPLPSANG